MTGVEEMLKLVEFIKNNPNWEELLQTEPYNLIIKRKENFILFYYNQISSDFKEPLVGESRGIILEDKTFNVLCYSFDKFWNSSEELASDIDWDSARVLEKMDGSMIKLWNYNNQWRVSTMATIDAKDAPLISCNENINTFYDLFELAWKNNDVDIETLNKDYTYIFELVSPYNRVVVNYPKADLYHIGTRDNKTLKELNIDIGFKKPKEYSFSNLDEVVEMAEKLPYSEEGYVIVDKHWNRVKVKSPSYVAVHHLKNNGVISEDRALIIIKKNEKSEFLSYFPEYSDDLNKIEAKYKKYLKLVNESLNEFDNYKDLPRKDFAMWAKTTANPHIAFRLYDNKINIDEVNDYINQSLNYDTIKNL